MEIPPDVFRKLVKSHAASATAPGYRKNREPLSHEDADRILEIVSLAVTVDGRIADAELHALGVIGAEVRALAGAPPVERLGDAALAVLLGRIERLGTRDAARDRLHKLARELPDGSRHLAYKLSTAVVLSDLAVNDAEDDFEAELREALQITEEVADALDAEVEETIIPEEDPE